MYIFLNSTVNQLRSIIICRSSAKYYTLQTLSKPGGGYYKTFATNNKGITGKKVPDKNTLGLSLVYYLSAAFVLLLGASFWAVPLYDKLCKVTGYAGTVNDRVSLRLTKTMKRVENKPLTIIFNADTAATLQWNFRPLQGEIKVVPGETVLAFYTAENPTDKPVCGISTYNVVPFEAAQYFNKIQCFCFDEQQLNPHEQVDMPVFFYIDPEYARDPLLFGSDKITLSYTFFEAREGLELPFISRD